MTHPAAMAPMRHARSPRVADWHKPPKVAADEDDDGEYRGQRARVSTYSKREPGG
jgi:hypothetical protein